MIVRVLRKTLPFAAAAFAAALPGCNAPAVSIHEPTTALPEAPVARAASNGAIYQAATFRPLFEDRRARFVGDTLTISINEKISSAQQNSTSTSRSGSVSTSIPTVNVPLVNNVPVVSGYMNRLPGTEVEGSGTTKSDGKGATAASNTFTGTITVTVIRVLANGNLVVSGDKQIGTNREKETLRFSGVVNPATILTGNVVSSGQVADARLEYRGEGAIDSATVTGWLARFFLSFMPF